MRFRPHSKLVAATLLALGMLTAAVSSAQEAPKQSASAPKGAIIGSGAFTSFVENMDRSLAFYHDVFGMEVPPLPESGARNYNRNNPQLYAMFDIPGARERHESASVKGTSVRVEIMEVQDVPVRTLSLRMQDPGAVTLVFIVRDVDALLARAKAAKAVIVTPGGLPVLLADGARSVLMRDIDGRFIELRQPKQFAADAAADGVVDMQLAIAVADLARTTKLYREVLGFTVAGETAASIDAPLRALTGLTTAVVKRNRIQAPGSKLWIELVEYQGVERHAVPMRIQDRGAARLQLRAENIDAMVAVLQQAGLKVISQGGIAVPIPPNFKGALIADPNNFFLTLFAPCVDCGAGFPAAPAK